MLLKAQFGKVQQSCTSSCENVGTEGVCPAENHPRSVGFIGYKEHVSRSTEAVDGAFPRGSETKG